MSATDTKRIYKGKSSAQSEVQKHLMHTRDFHLGYALFYITHGLSYFNNFYAICHTFSFLSIFLFKLLIYFIFT